MNQTDNDTVVVTMTRREARELALLNGNTPVHKRLARAAKSNTYSTAKTTLRVITTNRSKVAEKGDMVVETTFVIPASESSKEGDIRGVVGRVLLMARVDAEEEEYGK